MTLEQIYDKILKICKENYIKEPFVVGGVPRDLYLGLSEGSSKDADLTTNDADSSRLGITLAYDIGNRFRMFGDGHVSVYSEAGALDFSGNFISDLASEYAKKEFRIDDKGLLEVYSRDFTINTLHKRLMDDEIIDLIGSAKKDLDKKLVRTIVPPEITFGDDLRRLFRAISFAARLNFSIDGSIIDFARNNKDILSKEKGGVLRDAFITSIIGEAVGKNADIALGYLVDMELLPSVPLSGVFKDELIKRKMVNKYLDDSIELREYELKSIEF